MRGLLPSVLLGLSSLATVAAEVNYIDAVQFCVSGCSLALKSVTFSDTTKSDGPKASSRCADTLFVDSLLLCAKAYCTSRQIDAGLSTENATCISAGSPLPDFTTFVNNHEAQLASVMRLSKSQVSTTFNQPVIPDAQYYALAHDSIAAPNYAEYLNWVFIYSCYGYWGLVILVGIVTRAIQVARRSFLERVAVAKSDGPGTQPPRTLVGRLTRWSKRRLMIPLVVGGTSDVSPPTRVEGLLVAGYIAMIFAFCFPGYHIFAGNLTYPHTAYQLGQYVTLRFGALAIANFPLIWIFASRNDPLMWLTGWTYATFSQFHRWTARVSTVLAVGHAIGRSVLASQTHRYTYKTFSMQWWYCGVIAVIALSLLVATSLYFIRNRFYDLFLIIHFILAMMALVTIWFHVQFQPGVYTGFIWACVAIWVWDRVLRIGRTAYYSLTSTAKSIKAPATFDPVTGLVRLDVTDIFKHKTVTPGSFFFVYEPARLRGYESHPFTLCSWKQPAVSGSATPVNDSLSDKTPDSELEKMPDLAASSSSSTNSTSSEKALSRQRHTFLIRPQKGYTERLRKKVHEHPDQTTCNVTLLLEGPYGENFALQRYTDVVFLVGGSGITSALSRAYSVLHDHRSTAKVHLIWTVQHRDVFLEVSRHELSGIIGHPRLKLDIYLSKETASESQKREDDDLLRNTAAKIHFGRPGVHEILHEAQTTSSGRLAVMVCGPPGMTEAARKSVVKLLGEKGGDIAFYEERFGW